jgi:uncharacterized membrane protein YeaQ/YmgE (transglycosylase-associated protein family)
MLGALASIVVSGFVIGGLARLALPGPDPMPFWLTVLLGFGGSIVGGGIAAAVFGGADSTFETSGHAFVTLLLEIVAAAGLLALYRRYVQRRPLTGPGAYRFPSRGFGIERMRKRLRQLGVDPDTLTGRGRAPAPAQMTAEEHAAALQSLRERHERGELGDEEYEQARERLRRY